MNVSNIIRFSCIALIWVLLCYLMIKGRGLNAFTVITLLISAGIVFIPLYKKYIRKD